MNIGKDLNSFFATIPPGARTNSIYWLQKKIMKKALKIPRAFNSKGEWEEFRKNIRENLPSIIGLPKFPELKESAVRARIRLGEDVLCERVDIYVDEDYGIPSFVFLPVNLSDKPMPGLVWSPGFPQNKWDKAYEQFAVRMARQGFVVLILDHAPFGETSSLDNQLPYAMSLVMGMCNLLGMSQLALRAAETMRAGEYLRSRNDVDGSRVAVSGLCQGGMDTWLAAALDDGFCAAAPFCAASTFAIHMAEMASYRANADSSPFPFGILDICDVEHLHACIVPRPLLVRANLPDDWWPVSGFDDIESFCRKIYKLYNAEDRIDFRAEINEHNLTGPFADALEKFLLEYV